MVAWSFFLSVSLNNMNLLSSKAVCLFKDKKMRVLTNLLVAHLCCEANSFLACATSVKTNGILPHHNENSLYTLRLAFRAGFSRFLGVAL